MKLNSLEASEKLQVSTLSQNNTTTSVKRQKPTYHNWKNNLATIEINGASWKPKQNFRHSKQNNSGNSNIGANNSPEKKQQH